MKSLHIGAAISPDEALREALEKRQDGEALLLMHSNIGNLIQANGALCQVMTLATIKLYFEVYRQ